MGMKNPIPTYSYLVEKVKELYSNLAYLSVIEPRTEADPDFGQAPDNTKEASNEFIRKIWSPRPLILAGGFVRQTAIDKAEDGTLISFGRHFIANVSRIESILVEMVSDARFLFTA
jgi:NADPH2 dehydrogenase